jgi:hypothetical protein
MNFLSERYSTASDSDGSAKCPFHQTISPVSEASFEDWLNTDLRCSAGKREFQLGRYLVARVRNGYQFERAFEDFKQLVENREKTGFLALVETKSGFCDAEAELRFLGQIVVDAGYADSAGALVAGETVAVPIELPCPVTGHWTTYEFFPVAFCRHAARVLDPLYDPALSAPFLAINTTSDAYAFGMLVRDLSLRHFHCEPHDIRSRHDFERLLERCAVAWQNMSVNTIQSYGKVSERPERAVRLSADETKWEAPHQDPVFAELEKRTHSHEMPVLYARRLCQKWTATLFEGEAYRPSRDGQSGGIPAFATGI